MSSTHAIPEPSRNFGLDALRACSILLVLLQHRGVNIPGLYPLKIGAIGVEFFFVLSGFLIGSILFKDLDRNLPAGQTLKTFWVRRWFRILPLYYIVLLFKFIVIDRTIGANILYYFFFLQNNFYGPSYLPVSWSLVIEEWFYLLVPVFLLFVRRFFPGTRNMLIFLVLFLVAVNVFRFFFVSRFMTPYEGVNGNFVLRMDSLFLGVTLAFLHHRQLPVYRKLQSPWVLLAGVICFTGYLFYFRMNATPVFLINTKLFFRTAGFFILPFSIALMLPFIQQFSAFRPQSLPGKLLLSAVTWTSILTYAIYLVHPFIFEWINHFTTWSSLLKSVVSIALTAIVAYFVYRFIEKPFLRWRNNHFPDRRPQL